MVSPCNREAFSSGHISLPLSKFSYATLPAGSKTKIPWTHLSSKNDLFAVFDTSHARALDGNFEERQRFRVLRDPEVMEELDLEILSRETTRALKVAQDPLAHSFDPKSVAVIVQAPMIAMKYPLFGDQVRRFQIRFTTNEGYYEAMKMFSRADITTMEPGTFPVQRPQTAPSLYPSMVSMITHPGSQNERQPLRGTSDIQAEMLTLPVKRNEQTHIAIEQPSGQSSNLPAIISSMAQHQRGLAIGRIYSDHDLAMPQAVPNLYTPRPSTAPEATTQHLSQMLPPKRDLPFEVHRARPTSFHDNDSNINQQTKSKSGKHIQTLSSAKGSETEQTYVATSEPQADSSTKRKASVKETSLKPKEPKKPRKSASRACPTKKPTGEELPVPSVEELLTNSKDTQEQEPGGVEKYSKGRDLNLKSDSEIQHSTAFVRALGSVENVSNGERMQTRSRSKQLQILNHIPERKCQPQPDMNEHNAEPDPPCTPIDQMMQPITSTAFVHQNTSTLPLTTPVTSSNISQTPNTNADTAQTAPSGFPSPTDFAQAWSLLNSDPSFSNSTSRLKSWTELPAPQRKSVLTTYICQQIKDPNFIELCKKMETTWQALFLGPGTGDLPRGNYRVEVDE